MEYRCFKCDSKVDAPTWHYYDGKCRECAKSYGFVAMSSAIGFYGVHPRKPAGQTVGIKNS